MRRSFSFKANNTKKLEQIAELQMEYGNSTGAKLDAEGLKKKLLAGITINALRNSIKA